MKFDMLPFVPFARNSLQFAARSMVGLMLLAVGPAYGTDRYFPDLSAKSENGIYLVEAKSPDNAIVPTPPFQDHFQYTLTHLPSGKQRWEWKPERHSNPLSLNVHDSGVVVVWNVHDEFEVIGIDGKAKVALALHEYISKDEFDRWAQSRGWAGQYWNVHSLWYFCHIETELYFVVRTYWDRRLVIDIKSRSAVNDLSRIQRELDACEKQIALKVLTEQLDQFTRNARDVNESETQTAAYLCGKLQIHEAIPLLKQLESAANATSSVTRDENGTWRCENSLRQVVQLSLRRLSANPIGYPATFICFTDSEPKWNLLRPAICPTRAAQSTDLPLGLSRIQVLALLGNPDYVGPEFVNRIQGEYEWEYDMDADVPFTLRLNFQDNDHKLTKISRIEPLWRKTGVRDKYLSQ
ncbi:MAG: hypothetical protein JWM11_8013 [Planctomycetaceae bacterium]|nr:hypothetical protein [Planctomycetaceae bacterium]